MESDKIFRTKTGFCHILDDRIILTRDGVIGNLAKVTVGKSVTRTLIIYGGLSLFLFYTAFNSFKTGEIGLPIFLVIIGLYLIYGILTSLNNSAIQIINRSNIKEVKLKKAILGITRTRFEVMFEGEDGKVKKRLIMLPGSLNDGTNETEKAIKIMSSENLLQE
ncbi:MAG: hypothetical protein ACI8Q1_003744 [Parvicella sp.]|jgi:hypothetical protein